MASEFHGCRVVVAGGGGVVGSAVANFFVAAGAKVVATGVSAVPSSSALDERVAYRALDVRDAARVAQFGAEFAELDVLVNAVGTLKRDDAEYDPEIFASIVETNLVGAYRLYAALQQALVRRKGNIVTVLSSGSLNASPPVPAYGASRAGIAQLNKTLAARWAADGVRVNGVMLSWIRSKMTDPVRADEARMCRIAEHTPMGGCWGDPGDVAAAIGFLASRAAAFITGATLAVDGGYTVVS